MRLLYLSYWGIDDGLTQATVYPHLEVLAASPKIEFLLFVSVERGPGGRLPPDLEARGIRHAPLRARSLSPAVVSRAIDFVALPAALERLVREHRITMILARGANAGALAHLTAGRASIPYAVESFEPHAAYMRESGVWGRWDPRYIFQKRWEEAQKLEAVALLPVTDAYRSVLIEEGVPAARTVTLPCTVDPIRFGFSAESRRRTREQLGTPPDAIAGIYVGKFGDIYYDKGAFVVLARFARQMPTFRMIVLTGMDPRRVMDLAEHGAFPRDKLFVASVPHAQVPRYLSAADLAFALVRMAPSRRFCSPVKVGEYLASGLPMVITEGIGEDSDIVRDHDAGAVIDLGEVAIDAAIRRIRGILAEPGHRERIAGLATRFRARGRVAAAYSAIGLI